MRTLIGYQDGLGSVRVSTCDLTYEPEIFWPNYLRFYGAGQPRDPSRLAEAGRIDGFDEEANPVGDGGSVWFDFRKSEDAVNFFERYNAKVSLAKSFRWFYLYYAAKGAWFVYDFDSQSEEWTNLSDAMRQAKKYRVAIREVVVKEVEVWGESAAAVEYIVGGRYESNDGLPWQRKSDVDAYIQTYGYDKDFGYPTGESTYETPTSGY